MLRALSVISVRQKHYESILDIPFGFAGTDELVDDDLGTIRKITKLRLPKYKRVWMCLSIAKFEAEDSEFGQVGV